MRGSALLLRGPRSCCPGSGPLAPASGLDTLRKCCHSLKIDVENDDIEASSACPKWMLVLKRFM